MLLRVFGAAVFLAGMTGVGYAQSPVTAQSAWARATPPGATAGAVYLTLTSPDGDTLTGVTSPAAAKSGVHETHMAGNVMQMRAVTGGLALPAGKPVSLQPGGYHVMLEGLPAPLKQGQTIALHLTFAKAPPLDVEAKVQAIGAAAPGMAASGMAAPGMADKMTSMPGMTMSK